MATVVPAQHLADEACSRTKVVKRGALGRKALAADFCLIGGKPTIGAYQFIDVVVIFEFDDRH